jgi:hypothetical protein
LRRDAELVEGGVAPGLVELALEVV